MSAPARPARPGSLPADGSETSRGRPPRLPGARPAGAKLGLTVMGLLVAAALFAPLLRPDHLLVTDLEQVLQPPTWTHPLGTDAGGRDLLALVLRGMRVSLIVAALAASSAVLFGTLIGLISGLAGPRLDGLIMRIVDFVSSQNHLLAGLLIATLARPKLGGAGAVTLAVGLTHWTSMARILRAEVLALRERPFVRATIGIGAGRRHLARHHLLPHLVPSAGLGFVLLFPHAIFHEAALSFLGFGLPAGDPSLGTLVAAGQGALLEGGWWIVLFPGAVIVLASLAVGSIGEWLRERSQPRWRTELER